MPTPFTHLLTAQQVLSAEADQPTPPILTQHTGAFLLGSVVADAHGIAGLSREDTHFYAYDKPMEAAPWRVMLRRNPTLHDPRDDAARAFVAGYVLHLSMDEWFSRELLRPYFGMGQWGDRYSRFYMLHILLSWMDERDQVLLESAFNHTLSVVTVDDWLPFLPADALIAWRDLMWRQLKPGGVSETLAIMAPRVSKQPDDLRATLDDADHMRRDLWANVPPPDLARIEAAMNAYAVEQMHIYLAGQSAGQGS